ncbi:hypothetical protein BDV93DRAFT_595741 [Ceratobasidium sp. AG-I]|nr:hypothetical protein BDV93DRAFT_595741 [Ceratobasidium sp. AG-I]
MLWNPLELAPTAKPKKTKEFVSTTTRMPNAKKGRAIYRAKDTDPIFIHSSVINYLASPSPEAAGEGYKPRATWYGYGPDELPRVEDVPHAHIVACSITQRPKFVFPEQAKKKLKLAKYKKTPGVLEKLGTLRNRDSDGVWTFWMDWLFS